MHLDKLTTFHGSPGPLLLIVMDGVGLAPDGPANAVSKARTPTLDRLLASDYCARLGAHGTYVGLADDGEMGNSEVGHNTLGGGRAFAQGAKLVKAAFDDGAIHRSEAWREVEARGARGGSVHFLGLLSDGNVHAHIDHLLALIERCREVGIQSVCVHALLDGRDVAPRSALSYLARLENALADINRADGFDYRIASGGGRMAITMDRYQADWAMVKRGFDAHVHGVARAAQSAAEEVQRQYDAEPGRNDQFLEPFVITRDGEPVGAMRDGDAVVLFNFRGDRAIEISRALESDEFDAFDRGAMPDLLFCGMLEYDGDLHVPRRYLVAPPVIERTMIEYLCAEKIKTFAVSETQKFGHVTYFWNGNRSARIDDALETWVEIPSDDIEFSRAPAMKAKEIADATIELLRSGEYRFGRINFANGDMVGHSGDIAATVRAVEAVDHNIARLIEANEQCGGATIVTADHGNADVMFVERDGERVVRTAHSLNPVMFAISDRRNDDARAYRMAQLDKPGLANVAATVFNLLGYRAPADYSQSLIEFPGEPRGRRAIYQGAVVDLGLETVQLPNDELAALEIARHPGGAVAVARDDHGRVALIRQFRHAAGGWIWEFPA
ncbi:MAG: 2,3-bisphosphoglycerate-independent phosphoglycerate mutase, partial [bacterium]